MTGDGKKRSYEILGVGIMLLLVSAVALASAESASAAEARAGDADAHAAEIEEWRRQRHSRLASDSGWLTLVGLEWLQEGANRVGSAEDSDIRIPGGPEEWGTIILEGHQLSFEPAPGAPVTIDDWEAWRAPLISDRQGNPTVVRSGNLSFYVIYRQSYALRIKDRQAPTLLAFSGVENYPIDPDWRIDARFIPAEAGQTLEIGNVLGQLEHMPVVGTIEFEREGQTVRLVGVKEKSAEAPWFLFADRTTGRETYGAGRFLYANGQPQDGRLVVDFNKAYNPPCAFNDYSTCPLPPAENRLDFAVRAGEKKYRHD